MKLPPKGREAAVKSPRTRYACSSQEFDPSFLWKLYTMAPAQVKRPVDVSRAVDVCLSRCTNSKKWPLISPLYIRMDHPNSFKFHFWRPKYVYAHSRIRVELPPKGERRPLSRHGRGTHAVVWSLILSLEVVYYGPCASKTASEAVDVTHIGLFKCTNSRR